MARRRVIEGWSGSLRVLVGWSRVGSGWPGPGVRGPGRRHLRAGEHQARQALASQGYNPSAKLTARILPVLAAFLQQERAID
jgi:hypothetical protein